MTDKEVMQMALDTLWKFFTAGGTKTDLLKATEILEAAIDQLEQQSEPAGKPCLSPYCECSKGNCTHPGFFDARHQAVSINEVSGISGVLAQPEPEPVAWMYDFPDPNSPKEYVVHNWITQVPQEIKRNHGFNVRPLYLASPKREFVELTNVESYKLLEECTDPWELMSFTQDKLKDKNT